MTEQGEPRSIVFVIDDDAPLRETITSLLRSVDLEVEAFGSGAEFLRSRRLDVPSCLILDVRLPGLSGLDFQSELAKAGIQIPIIFITGHGDIPMTVRAMKAGSVDFLAKPFRDQDLLDAVTAAIQRDQKRREQENTVSDLRAHFSSLTRREREVMALVASGLMSKQIAAQVGLSEITVKVHRSRLMKKMGAKSVADLVRMKLTSFRMKDQLHVKDLDSARLITAEIEAGLPAELRGRLEEVRGRR